MWIYNNLGTTSIFCLLGVCLRVCVLVCWGGGGGGAPNIIRDGH